MNQPRKISEYFVGWGLWAVTSALGIFIMFWAVRGAINALTEAATMGAMLTGTPGERFQVPLTRNAVDRFATLFMGILAVLMIVLVEYYYRSGVESGTLWRRFMLVTAIEFGVLFVALAIQVIFMGALGLFTVWSLVLPVAALAVTVLLSWLLTRRDGHAAAS
ncbi:MAG: hypothetical protein ACP5UQ_03525 [Anaerolineae bacterium]